MALIPALRLMAVAGSMLSAGWLAEQLPGLPGFPPINAFWLPAGIAFAALYFWGPLMAVGLLAGGAGLAWLQDTALLPAAVNALVGVAAPAIALVLLRVCGWRSGRGDPAEAAPRDLVLVLCVGVFFNAAIGALAGTALRAAFEGLPQSQWLDIAAASWASQTVGLLLVLGPLLDTGRQFTRQASLMARAPWLAGLLLVSLPLFLTPKLDIPGLAALPFLPPLVLCGLALRSRAWSASAAALLLALLAAGATAAGLGPFVAASKLEELAQLWGFAACAALLPLLIDAVLAHREAENRRWVTALEADGTGIAEWSARAGMRANAQWEKLATVEMPANVDPVQWLEISHPMDRERMGEAVQGQLACGGAEVSVEALRLPAPAQLLGTVHGTGAWRWHSLRVHVQQRDAQGRASEVLMLLSDISAQRTAEERQRMSTSLFQHLHEGLLVIDAQQRVLDANPSYCRMMGQAREALLSRPATLLLSPTLRRSGHSTEQMLAALQTHGFWSARVEAERADGSPCMLQLTVSSIPEPIGAAPLRVVTVTDLTQTLQQQQQLERQAHSDALTGLPNHEEFVRLLRQSIDAAQREGFTLSICRVDLDQFKRINIDHGDETGDTLLLQMSQRLRSALRTSPQWSDVIGRLTGDEFGLILRTADAEEAQHALERLLNVLRAPCRLPPPRENQSVELTASIGATLFPADPSDAETLLRHAGHALYRVKQHAGRNAFRFFDTAKRQRDEASLIAIARMQQALDSGELHLFYQPKIDMRAGRVLGVEALLRWQHPEQGLLLPGDFLSQIEGTGLEVQVGDWIIGHALKQSAQWLAQGLTLEVSVNVTARQLQVPDFALRLQELIQRHAEPVAQHLCLEVLESEALADVDATHALIQRCKGFGVRFALDDFGTGYSTLTYLRKLPVDALKVDRSFVQNMLIDVQDMALIEGVVGLARHFGCSVIAEGVESAAHARALLRLGCPQGQGNGIAAAMPSGDVAAWVDAFARSPWLTQLGAERPLKAEAID